MGVTRDDVAVRLKLENQAKFKKGMDDSGKSMGVFGRAAEKSAKQVKKGGHEVATFEKGLHSFRHVVGLAAGITGLAALGGGIHEVVSSAVNAEASVKGLENSVGNAGISWRKNRVEIEKNLDAQTLWAGFQKADVASSLSNMVRSTGNVNSALKLNHLAVDIAHKKNMGLAAAQSLVARVYNGSFMGLKRLGINIKPVTKNQDELRNAVKHYTVEQMRAAKADDARITRNNALRIATSKFKGSTDAWGKSAQGSAARARIAIELAQEKIGNLLLPTIAKAAQGVAKLAMRFAKNWPQIQKSISKAIKPIVHDVKSVVGWFVKLYKGFQKGNAGAVLLVGGIAGLTAAFLAYKIAMVATSIVTSIIGGMSKAFWALDAAMSANPAVLIALAVIAVGTALAIAYLKVKWFHNAVNNVFNFIKHNWPLLLIILTGPIGLAVVLIVKNFKKIKGAIGSIGGAMKGIWNGLKTGLVAVLNWCIGKINTVINGANKLPFVNIGHIGLIKDDSKGTGNNHRAPKAKPASTIGQLKALPQSASPVHVHTTVKVDSKEISHVLVQENKNKARNR